MSAKSINLEEFRSLLDEKLVPLKSEISELNSKRSFIDMTNEKYEEVMSMLAE
ncbi:Hypothetical predicted protein [Paramuricea clavata]|uniref:Uncharacterized protein n=1 Tax=Paramuricea clavata TaxID=317549 RepID=A0A6S7G3F9_PARCT|nr:Hypothetical predicted protein [Paramuricea clavata]